MTNDISLNSYPKQSKRFKKDPKISDDDDTRKTNMNVIIDLCSPTPKENMVELVAVLDADFNYPSEST